MVRLRRRLSPVCRQQEHTECWGFADPDILTSGDRSRCECVCHGFEPRVPDIAARWQAIMLWWQTQSEAWWQTQSEAWRATWAEGERRLAHLLFDGGLDDEECDELSGLEVPPHDADDLY